jgi:hypothetical protein
MLINLLIASAKHLREQFQMLQNLLHAWLVDLSPSLFVAHVDQAEPGVHLVVFDVA